MGGFGAAHLGFKFPEIFGVISIIAPPLVGPKLKSPRPTRALGNLFTTAMLNDLDSFRANDPFTLTQKNSDARRDRTYNSQRGARRSRALARAAVRSAAPNPAAEPSPPRVWCFYERQGLGPKGCLDSLGDAAFSFFSFSLP